jgi:multidrug efflux system membrane fusion protein
MAKFRFHKFAAVVVLIGFAAWMGTGKFSSVGSAAAEGEKALRARPRRNRRNLPRQHSRRPEQLRSSNRRTRRMRAIRLSGQTEADKRAVLGTRAPGIIRELPIDEGQAVKAGDLIMALDTEDKPAMVEMAKQVVKQREAELAASQRRQRRAHRPSSSLTPLFRPGDREVAA